MKNLTLVFVPILLISLLFGSCKKGNGSKNYTANLGGKRIWYGSSFSPSGSNPEIDTSAISVINNTTISLFGCQLNFSSEDDQLKIITFGYNVPSHIFPVDEASLQYYYASDSMVFQSALGSYGAASGKMLTSP